MHSQKYRAIVFDWDGTLLDSTSHIVGAIRATCSDLNLPIPPKDEAGWVIGLSLQAALYRLVPDLPESQVDIFIERYRSHFMRMLDHMQLFQGQQQLLQQLQAQDWQLAVATGKSRKGLDASMDKLNLRSYFVATRTVDEARGKPDPDMLLQLLDELRLDAQEVLMVGDTTHDVLMAKAAGIDSLAVGYGAHKPAILQAEKPTAYAASVAEMQALLLGLRSDPLTGQE